MVPLGSASFPLGLLHPSFSHVSLDDVGLGSLPPCSSSPLCCVLCPFASPWDARGQGCRRTPRGAGDPWARLTGVCSWSTGLCRRKSLMQGLCHVFLSYLQSWSAPLSPCLQFLHRTRTLGFMKFVVPCRREPQNFQNCFAFKKNPKTCCCCSHLCSRHQLWMALGGVPAQLPSAAFDHWARLVNTLVLQSSCWARGCREALAGDPPFPKARTVCPSLAWGHRDIPMALGSVPWAGGVAGVQPGEGCSGTKNLNPFSYGEALAFHSFGWARSL